MKRLRLLLGFILAVGLAACGNEATTSTPVSSTPAGATAAATRAATPTPNPVAITNVPATATSLPATARPAAPATTAPVTPTASAPGNYEQTLAFENLNRSYLLHLPPAIKEQKALPLVIVIHGATGNALSMALLSRMSPKADKEGFIAVYPNGTDTGENDRFNGSFYWNVGYCCGSAGRAGINDVGFISVLIEKLEKSYKIDSKRIYVTGFSNGGMMSHLLGIELGDKLAAIAPVAGMLGNNPKPAPQSTPVIAIHGLDDGVVPYNSGAKAVTYWALNNKCAPAPQKQEEGKVIKEIYAGCSKGGEVVFYSIKGLGHSWPQQSLLDPDAPISATDLIWEFFASHPKA